MPYQDAEIIQGLKAGYKERLQHENALYLQYDYFINEGIKKFNLDYDNSFSAYSDAVLSAIHNIIAGRFDGRASLKTYLFEIFRNKCVDLVRKTATNKEQVHNTLPETGLLDQLPDGTKTVIEKLMNAQRVAAIKLQLESIGAKCKEILLLFEDGLTDRQIATELAYNSAAVAKTTRLRCLEKLRDNMGGGLRAI